MIYNRRNAFLICLNFLIMIFLSACQARIKPNMEPNNGINVVIQIEGTVRIKKPGWYEYSNLDIGMVVSDGDILKLDKQATVIIVCSDLTLWEPLPGNYNGVRGGCSRSDTEFLVRDKSLIGVTRAEETINLSQIPYLISPRATKISTLTPKIIWHGVPGTSQYFVEVTGKDYSWRSETTKTTVTIPEDTMLDYGQNYEIIITTDTGFSSKDEGSNGVGVQTINKAHAQEFEEISNQIQELDLSDQSENILLAHLYYSMGYIYEAQLLLSCLTSGSDLGEIELFIGQTYYHIGLFEEALGYLDAALSIGIEEDNSYLKARTYYLLNKVYNSTGSREMAIINLENAIEEYSSLGDKNTKDYFEAELKALTGDT